MKSHAKKAVKEVMRLGYEYSRTNSSGFEVYTHPVAGDISLNQAMNEQASRSVIRQAQKAVGALARTPGRNAEESKRRRAARVALDAERLAAERRDIDAQHAAYLARIDNAPLTEADRQEIAFIEARLREIAEMERLMVSTPVGSRHAGVKRARHTSGSR